MVHDAQLEFERHLPSCILDLDLQAVTWSTWLSALLSVKDPNPADSNTKGGTLIESEEGEFLGSPKPFNLLKVTGDLLMMPREMAMRREVCQIIAIKSKCRLVQERST